MRPQSFILVALALALGAGVENAHADKKLMVGVQAMVTAEAEEGSERVLGVNVVPIVVEYAPSLRLGVRLNSIVNLQITGGEYAASHRGLGFALPVYLGKTSPDARTYIGPYVGYARNPLVDGDDLTLAVEFGLRWPIADSLSLNLTFQGGASHLFRPDANKWVSHIGIHPGLGYWFSI